MVAQILEFLTSSYTPNVAPPDPGAPPEQMLALLANIQPLIAAGVHPIDQPPIIVGELGAPSLDHAASFRIFDPELLLEQAAAFLDRCLASRREWNEVNEKRFTTHLGLWVSVREELVRVREEAAGLYENSQKISTKQVASEGIIKKSTAEAWGFYDDWEKELHGQGGQVGTPKYREVTAERNRLADAKEVSATRLENLRIEDAWNTANVVFQQDRAEIANSAIDMKREAFSTVGGAYDFTSQMDSILSRFLLDASEALQRLEAAASGLKQFYGYPTPLPDNILQILAEQPIAGQGFLDDAVKWTQRALSWLLRFNRLDQLVVSSLSLKAQVGEEAWEAGRGGPESSVATWRFQFKDPLITSASHVRLRGVSAHVVRANAPSGVWRGVLRVPERGKIKVAQEGGAMQELELDQSSLPEVKLGRIGRRQDLRGPDIAGIAALNNGSPFSANDDLHWTFSIFKTSTQGEDDFADVELDIYLALRT